MHKKSMNGNVAGRFKAFATAFIVAVAILLLSVFIPVRTGGTSAAASSVFTATSSDGTSSAIAITTKTVVLKHDDLNAEVIFGNDGKSKLSRNVPVTVKITNNGDDFSGIIRIRINTSYSASSDGMVEQTFDIAAGQSKTLQMLLMPLDNDFGGQLIELCDKDGDVLDKKDTTNGTNRSPSNLFVGVLSDDATGFGYLKSIFEKNVTAYEKDVFDEDNEDVDYDVDYIENQAVAVNEIEDVSGQLGSFVELKADDISDDADYLDMYDLLIIDNFDTSSLRPEQKKAIVSWVKNGGTLLLSTGGNPDKVLGGFADEEEFKVSVDSAAKTVKTSFGWSKEDIIQYSGSQGNTNPIETLISSLTLTGKDKVVLKDENGELLQKKEIGMGALMVSEFSMSLPQEVWSTYGGALLYMLGKNMGRRYIMDTISNSVTNGYYYYSTNGINSMETALNRNESKSLPNLTLYTFLLLAYAVIAGPILYIVFLKTDKRTWLWGAIPATAVVFSLLIYLLGSSTRIQRPYIKYITEISLDNGDIDNSKMDTQFTVTSPANKRFGVDLKKDMVVMPDFTENFYSDGVSTDNSYKYGVHREGDSLSLDLAGVSAFRDMFFKSKQNVSVGGDVDMDIKEEKGKPSGIITNNTKYTLENCFVYYNMELYYWDEIPAGESVSIENADYYPNSYLQKSKNEDGEFYVTDHDSVMEDTTWGIYRSFGYQNNYDTVNDNRVARKMSMVTDKISRNYMANMTKGVSNFFCGFLKEGDDKEMFTSAFDGLESYGVTAVTKLCR